MKENFDCIEMKVPAKSDYVAIVRLTVAGVANRMGFSYDDIEDMKIAVSEACTNVVQHAYKESTGEITIAFGLYANRLEIMIVDNGVSFDFESLKDKMGPYDMNEEVERLPEGGLGIYLINTLMDEVKMNHNHGMVVFMTKHIQREQGENDGNTISTYEAY
ncbi:serine/threonine protein kinase [Bacillus manliponensis]|uniref:Serine-protein kinase RsbW n=1 Tax=Bacillus manliponensis TaxID=574376 RepID=A0A073KA56_9BACI|nr:anti-sigma B factor RsbW [Bacillus manliponensis]KEK19173.1 serine/threonine protein kinase [Bacillus manliponensis]